MMMVVMNKLCFKSKQLHGSVARRLLLKKQRLHVRTQGDGSSIDPSSIVIGRMCTKLGVSAMYLHLMGPYK